MRWQDLKPSENVEDRRGQKVGRGPLAMGGGVGALLIGIVIYFLGGDPSVILGPGGGTGTTTSTSANLPPESRGVPAGDTRGQFVAAVLGSTEEVWNAEFSERGSDYAEPRLVLFSDGVRSACGFADAAVGPFYCPGDRKVYIDLDFFQTLQDRLGAPGDFAQAYVVAHEVGHHVQNLMGTFERADSLRQRARSQAEANQVQVRVELQADCLAGVWAARAQQMRAILEPGDVEEALGAASAVGDDTLQRRAQGRVVPDSFTHGSAESRTSWFRRGLESAGMEACDTFTTEFAERASPYAPR